MSVPRPHFLLFCDGSLPSHPTATSATLHQRGRWRFVLESLEDSNRLEAADAESADTPDRLALFAVVRGLEALQQPSHVTLVTSSRYVSRGLQYGLNEWRENNYCWEHFGAFQPIRNRDLWQRVDHALQFHDVTCRHMAQEQTAIVETHSLAHTSVAPSTIADWAYSAPDQSPSEVLAVDSLRTLREKPIEPIATDENIKLAPVAGNRWRRIDKAHFPVKAMTKSKSVPIARGWLINSRLLDERWSVMWQRVCHAMRILFGKNAIMIHGQIVS